MTNFQILIWLNFIFFKTQYYKIWFIFYLSIKQVTNILESSEDEPQVEVSSLKVTSPSKSIISKQKQRKINQIKTKRKENSSDDATSCTSESSSSKSEESTASSKRV